MWRNRFAKKTTRKILDRFSVTNLNAEFVKSITFEQLVLMLREKPVIEATKAALQRIHLQCTFRHGSPSQSIAPQNVNVRVFLAAYMIAYRPTHVFESMAPLEQSLFESAVPLMSAFEKIVDCLRSQDQSTAHFASVPADLTKEFPVLLFEYLKRFTAWKIPDEAKLTCRIKHALIALYQAEQHLPPNEPEDSRLKVEFRTQIERLRAKLTQIAGADALIEFDRLRPDLNGGGRGGGGEAGTGAYAALPGRMTNEQLAYELLLDPTFQLNENGSTDTNENLVMNRMQNAFHQAFWDSLVDDLKLATPCYVRVFRVLKEIKDGIADLAGLEHSMMDEIVDLDFLQNRVNTGALQWGDVVQLFTNITTAILRFQAPVRDDETKGMWTPLLAKFNEPGTLDTAKLTCEGLEYLLNRVNRMRIDAANARLRLIAPVIRDHGIDYAQKKLKSKIDDGTFDMNKTKAWIEKGLDYVISNNKITINDLTNNDSRVFSAVISGGMVNLLNMSPTTFATVVQVPETLHFDIPRLSDWSATFIMVCKFAAALATVVHFVQRNKEEEKYKTFANIKAQISDEASSFPLDTTDWHPTLATAMANIDTATEAVYLLMKSRISDVVYKLISGQQLGDMGAFNNTLDFVMPRLIKLIPQITNVRKVNIAIALTYYNAFIAEACTKKIQELAV